MELIEQLGIDVKVLIAQIINFFLLLILLYKFLYTPLLKVLDKRRKKIEKSLEEAKEIHKRMEQVEIDINGRIAASKKESSRILEEAKQLAEAERKKTREEAVQDIAAIKEKAREEIAQEKDRIVADARKEIGELVVALAEKIIKRNFTPEDEKRIARELVDTIESSKSVNR